MSRVKAILALAGVAVGLSGCVVYKPSRLLQAVLLPSPALLLGAIIPARSTLAGDARAAAEIATDTARPCHRGVGRHPLPIRLLEDGCAGAAVTAGDRGPDSLCVDKVSLQSVKAGRKFLGPLTVTQLNVPPQQLFVTFNSTLYQRDAKAGGRIMLL